MSPKLRQGNKTPDPWTYPSGLPAVLARSRVLTAVTKQEERVSKEAKTYRQGWGKLCH